jgi:hypothetical protein
LNKNKYNSNKIHEQGKNIENISVCSPGQGEIESSCAIEFRKVVTWRK